MTPAAFALMQAHYRRLRYETAITSDYWKALKTVVRARCDGICEWPGCQSPCEALHHLHYHTLSKEQPEDVVYLCGNHHAEFH